MKLSKLRLNARLGHVVSCVVSLVCSLPVHAHIYFVDVNAPAQGHQSGMSWRDAFRSLTDALHTASAGDQIWVAQGTYAPETRFDKDDPRSATFFLPAFVELYGGFSATECSPAQRDLAKHATILSGDLQRDDQPGGMNRDDNAYHVVSAIGERRSCVIDVVLDGFIITGGNADGGRCTSGGGLLLEHAIARVRSCVFKDNHAQGDGGAIAAVSEEPYRVLIAGCEFESNSAEKRGGAVFVHGSRARVEGCAFIDNKGGIGGAVCAGELAEMHVHECRFERNDGGDVCGTDSADCAPDAAAPPLTTAAQPEPQP